jgi:hypothetical protein
MGTNLLTLIVGISIVGAGHGLVAIHTLAVVEVFPPVNGVSRHH